LKKLNFILTITLLLASVTHTKAQDGVLINGVMWATCNVDSPGTFASQPYEGMFYQWSRKIGWSSTNPMVSSDGGTAWSDSYPIE